MQHTGLHERQRPRSLDRVGQALEPVADDDADILDAAVLDLGQHLQPELGALAAVAGPQPEDVALTVDGDADGHVDGRLATWPSRILTTMASMNTTG